MPTDRTYRITEKRSQGIGPVVCGVHAMSTSPKTTSPPKSPTATSPRASVLATSPDETRARSGSWLGRLGEGRRRSGSIASAQSPTSPVVGRSNRSPSVSGGVRGRALSISLESDKETVPDVLGSLMFSPRADKLEDSFVIENQSEVRGAVLLNSAGLSHFYMAEYRGEKVLQKVIKYRNIDDRVLASFEKEVAVLSTLAHPNIVRFVGAKATPPDLFMVLEWMARGSLSSLLLNDLSTEISWTQRLKWSSDVAKGIEYLHSLKPKIIHRDLRCDNVMVNEHNVAKVSEFGLSRRKRFAMKASPRNSVELIEGGSPVPVLALPLALDDKGKDEHGAHHDKYAFVSEGGPAFTAPELLQGKAYSEKVDSFNFGMLLWQIMTRQAPHRGRAPVEVAEAILHANLRPTIPDYVPGEMAALIRSCWAAEEDKRPSSEAIVHQLAELLKAGLEPDLPTEDVETSASEGSHTASLEPDKKSDEKMSDYL